LRWLDRKADSLRISVTRHEAGPVGSDIGDPCVERVRGRAAAAVMVEVIVTGGHPLSSARARESRDALGSVRAG
jgi:hypothetical protein